MAWEGSIQRDDAGQPVAIHFGYVPDELTFRRYRRGDRVKAFAWWEWRKTGDVGDNSQFWLPATVLHFYQRPGDGWLVDLLFDCGRESRAHFAYGLRPLN